MTEDTINKMYEELYNSKVQELLKEKNNALTGIATREQSIKNQFDNTQNQLNTAKTDLSNKYGSLRTGLDTQAKEGKEKYYNDRNNASYSNAKNVQSIRDYMARNNLLQSGESVDALMRNNTDFTNSMSGINKNETSFNTNLLNTRNQYAMEEANNYSKLANDLAAALKDRDTNMAQLQAERSNIDNNYTAGVSGARSEINAQKTQALAELQEALVRAYSSSGSSSSGGGSRSSSGSDSLNKTEMRNAIDDAFHKTYSSNDLNALKGVLDDAYTGYLDGYITDSAYKKYEDYFNQLKGILERPNNSRTNKVMKY